MERIVDIHSHILPGTDDGACDMEMSKKMLHIAYHEGIRTIIVTPHYSHHFTNTREVIDNAMKPVQAWLRDTYPDMCILPGCELFYSSGAVGLLKENLIYTLADSKYILVEVPVTESYKKIKASLQAFLYKGYHPVLAHAERYEQIHNLNSLVSLKEMGVYIQVNAGSITGKSGYLLKRRARKLLRRNFVDFIATDAHGIKKRAPELKQCIAYLRKNYGDEFVKHIFVTNPLNIINNKQEKR